MAALLVRPQGFLGLLEDELAIRRRDLDGLTKGSVPHISIFGWRSAAGRFKAKRRGEGVNGINPSLWQHYWFDPKGSLAFSKMNSPSAAATWMVSRRGQSRISVYLVGDQRRGVSKQREGVKGLTA